MSTLFTIYAADVRKVKVNKSVWQLLSYTLYQDICATIIRMPIISTLLNISAEVKVVPLLWQQAGAVGAKLCIKTAV